MKQYMRKCVTNKQSLTRIYNISQDNFSSSMTIAAFCWIENYIIFGNTERICTIKKYLTFWKSPKISQGSDFFFGRNSISPKYYYILISFATLADPPMLFIFNFASKGRGCRRQNVLVMFEIFSEGVDVWKKDQSLFAGEQRKSIYVLHI